MTSRSREKPDVDVSENVEIDAEIIAKVKEDPVAFAKIFCNFYPHWYQSEILRDHSQNIAIRMGRQMGKTSTTAIKALWYAYTRPDCVTKHEDNVIVIIAPSQRQSKIMYGQIRSYIHANTLLSSSIEKSTLSTIKLDNNSVIHNFPVGDNAERVRGFSINMLIVDEAAYINERIYDAVLPALGSTNGRLILVGTPASRQGLFYKAFYPEGGKHDLDFSTHWHPYPDALDAQKISADGVPLTDNNGEPIYQLNRGWIEKIKNTSSPAVFAQEYEAKFVDDATSFFSRQSIINSVEEYPLEYERTDESIYMMGVDFAKYHDSYVAIVIKKPPQYPEEPMRVAHIYEQREKEYSITVPKTVEIARRFNCAYVFCDSTGVGETNVEIIRNQIKGNTQVVGVNMTSLTKQNDMYENLARLMGMGHLKLPRSARELISQLSLLTLDVTPSGKKKIQAPEGEHDDFVDALSLACMATMKHNVPKTMMTSIDSVLGSGMDKDVRSQMRNSRRMMQQSSSKMQRGKRKVKQVAVFDSRGRIIGTRRKRVD